MEVAPSIHRFEIPLGERFVCVALVDGSEGCLLLDTGLRGSVADVVVPAMREIGLGPEALATVVSSHADFDHVGGNAEISAVAPKAEIVCHRLDRRQIESVDALIAERYGEFIGEHGQAADLAVDDWIRDVTGTAPVARTVEGGEVIDIGGVALHVLHVPGHSKGHLALYEPRSRCALISDAVLGNALPTAEGEPAFPPTYRYVEEYVSTIERLRGLDIDILVTGHYPVKVGAQVAEFLDESAAFTRRFDGALDGALKATDSRTTQELIAELSPQLGEWPEEASGFLVYPLVGHLERLERVGRVSRGYDEAGLALWARIAA
jgi:glyoxylase-like metal-dependent hydrolase (beta-lactamase superfamily II)